ncbi:MAG: hypothetical protein KGV58_01380 [Campylobacteraceae bacterium]|nr:hypothetical protein [Campylobacteraceae bacterium]
MKYFLHIFVVLTVFAHAQGEVSIFSLFPNENKTEKRIPKNTNSSFVSDSKNDDSGFVPNDTSASSSKASPFEKSYNTDNVKPLTKSLFAFYMDLPAKSYVGELIPLKIKLVIAREFESVQIISDDTKEGLVIDYMPELFKDEANKNVYVKDILFKALKPLSSSPNLHVELINNNKVVEKIKLEKKPMNIVKLNDDEGRFINVFAKNLEIKKYKTNTFDEKSYITVMEINAQYSNIEDIRIDGIPKQGIDTKIGDYKDSTIYYFIIFPKDKQNLQISYFNTNSHKFYLLDLPIMLEKDDLSTQINLNPKNNKFKLYKDIGILVFVFLIFILFMAKKRYILALLVVAIFALISYFKFAPGNINIKKNTKVRILPTENSTIFYTTSSVEHVERLKTVDSYIKILLPNQKIGWIKDEDIAKN